MKFALVILGCLVSTTAGATTESYTVCGENYYYGPSGVISSPNYPYLYYDNLDCYYYIYASTGSSLSFIFKTFRTESCCDHVTISCPSNSSFPPQQLSGSSVPAPVSIPWCSQGLVQFRTDGSSTDTGFSLDYYVNEEGCGNTLYNDSYGYVTSSNYPSNYGYNQNCSNIIWAPQQSTFYIYFWQFELENDCNLDWLEISCLDSYTQYGRFCGYYNSYSLYVYECRQVLLWFHSDGSNNYQGFNIEYNVYSNGGATTAQSTLAVTTSDPLCGDSSYYDSYGVISSPNYPGYYYNNLYCDYYVSNSAGNSLSFIFKSFHVENPDFVTISCPSDYNFPPQEYSGHTLPDPVSIPNCNQGRVNFRTDYTNVSSGYSIDYYVSSTDCGNTVYIGPNGLVNSPNWPDFYGYNQNCSNIIWATQESTIQLNFHFFNLQDNCSCDWLEISCLDNSEFSPYRYCGNYNAHELYIHRCSQVLLWFHSDDTSNYQGFFIEYTIYSTPACGQTSYFGPSGVITSPNYPGNYSNFLYCDYNIYASAGSSLSLSFESLNVQEDIDFVTISCPANSSYPKYEYTGDYQYPPAPFPIPECSQGLVNFHTDHTVVSSGFSLKYYVNVEGCGNTVYYESSGYVTSPNWPSNYGYNQNCYNIIATWQKTTFYLNFHSFTLHSCCSCDWLEVSCQDNSDYGPTRYCGSYPSFDTYIYNCSQVLLWFHSDGSSNDQGFNIEYSFYTNADDSKLPSNGTLKAEEKPSKNGRRDAAESVPSNGKLNAGENASSKGIQNAAENIPSNGKLKAEGNASSKGIQNAAENIPSNGKLNAEGNASSKGIQNAAENIPSNGKLNAEGNVPSNGKTNAEEERKEK